MPKSRSRYARAQARARYRKPKRRSGSFGWTAGITALVVIGVGLLIWTVASRRTEADAAPRPANEAAGEAGDHWHVPLDVNECGQWLPAPPEFTSKADNPDVHVGLHTHGDGLIHIEPSSSSEGGNNATVGSYLTNGGWSASSSSFELWDGPNGAPVEAKNGDECTLPDGTKQTGRFTWYVNEKKQSGDPSEYKPSDKDRIVFVFGPPGAKLADLGTPPNSQNVPADQGGAPPNTNPESTTPESPAPSAPPSS
jgi:hypothetical protein